VLVTEATQRLLCLDHGGFDPRPAAPLKGKRERVQLWAPRALNGVVDALPAEADHAAAPSTRGATAGADT